MKKILTFLFLIPSLVFAQKSKLTDDQLLDVVQKQTFQYFWDFGHPESGLARERSNHSFSYGDETCTTGGTGFGVMAIVVAVDRGWITRQEGAERVQKIVRFLSKAPVYHGVFPHWLHGKTGQTIAFSRKDDGGDLVETSLLFH